MERAMDHHSRSAPFASQRGLMQRGVRPGAYLLCAASAPAVAVWGRTVLVDPTYRSRWSNPQADRVHVYDNQ
jgi:hypothetical protein